jgi:phage replication-related protein YjqB (UPF0714/DUF867 family)
MTAPDATRYRGFQDLASAQVRGRDYEIDIRRRPGSDVAIIAPHGGRIEDGTSELARAIAGDDFHLYLFEGTRPSLNYVALHLTSHRFDEPECLSLIAECRYVIALHGCEGSDARVLLGGRDRALKAALDRHITTAGFSTETEGHRFPGEHPNNVCNRGLHGRGVQLEVTHPLRRSPGCAAKLAAATRRALGAYLEGPDSAAVTALGASLTGAPDRP